MSAPVNEPAAVSSGGGPRRVGCGGALLGVALILAGLAGFIFHRLESFPIRVRDAFAAVAGVQPRVTVNEHVVYEQSSPVLELAVLRREVLVERESVSTWLGSTKRLRMRGAFRIKVGYDLKQPFAVNIDGEWAQGVRIQMPPPRILSTELESVEVLSAEDGLWNHVKPEECAQEVSALNTEARLKANEQGMMAEAKKTFTDEVAEKIGPGHRVEVFTSASGTGIKN